MKKLLLSLKNFSLGLCIFFSWNCFAVKFQLIKKNGQSFSVSKLGDTRSVRTGEFFFYGDEVFLEQGASLSLMGPDDIIFHLSDGGHLKLGFETFSLLNGSLWIQSPGKNNKAIHLETSNAKFKFFKGDAIIQYSDINEKTNAFVFSGHAVLSNFFDKYKMVTLRDGEFSFFDENQEEGRPRTATLIGKESFKNIKSKFAQIQPLKKGGVFEMLSTKQVDLGQMNREIASLDSGSTAVEEVETPKNKILFIPARSKVKKKKVKSLVPVRVFARKQNNSNKKIEKSRVPASSVEKNIKSDLNSDSFLEALKALE